MRWRLRLARNRNLVGLVTYILFIAICTQCFINIVDSFAQFRDPLMETGEYALIKDRREFKIKEPTRAAGSNGNVPPPGTQMGQKQIDSILRVLPKRGNLLVWGLGYDSPFWHKNTRGKVVFLESNLEWFNNVTNAYPYLEAYKVTYTTNIVDSFYKYLHHRELWSDLDLRSQLPEFVQHIFWHVILVDAPKGFGDGPGRYQSIYTSSLLARKGTHIFVDDFERRVEHEYSLNMLGQPVEVLERPEVEGVVVLNLQAHFIKRKSEFESQYTYSIKQ